MCVCVCVRAHLCCAANTHTHISTHTHTFFSQDMFKAVQEEYDAEGVPWTHVDFTDNAETLALIEGRMGVISLLNEECLRPKG